MSKPESGIVNLKGREYQTVALRVHRFRLEHSVDDGWGIITVPVHINDQSVLFRAAIVHPDGREVAVGYAEEKRTNSGLNATSACEVAETSAIGRALAAAGLAGQEYSYASANEVGHAIRQQEDMEKAAALSAARFWQGMESLGLKKQAVIGFCIEQEWGDPTGWRGDQLQRFLKDVESGEFPSLYAPGSK